MDDTPTRCQEEYPTRECVSNLPADEKWPVPQCGVDRRGMLRRHAYPAYSWEVEAIGIEIAEHFEAPRDAASEINAILTAAEPTLHILDQIYRHAFHPLHLVTIGEALVCPPKTRAKQLADAFAPVIKMARRVEYVPPKPRYHSINPDTKDYKRFVTRVGSFLAFLAHYPNHDLNGYLLKQYGFREEHRTPIVEIAIAELRQELRRLRNPTRIAEKEVQIARLEALQASNQRKERS